MIIIFQNDHNQNFSRVDTLPELKKPTRHRQPLSIFTHCQIFIATHTWPHDLTCTSFSHAPRFLSPSSSHPHPYAPPPYHTPPPPKPPKSAHLSNVGDDQMRDSKLIDLKSELLHVRNTTLGHAKE